MVYDTQGKNIYGNIKGTPDDLVGLAHELTNRLYSCELSNLQKQVSENKITPEQYEGVITIEVEGMINQILVTQELGISDNEWKSTVDALNSGKITLDDVRNSMLQNMKTTGAFR
jgi:hypothetical protein